MPNYNPYMGMPRGPGAGSSYSYGQQGRGRSALPSTPPGYYVQGSSQGYPGGGQRDAGSQNYWDRPNQGWGDQWSRDGYSGGYPGQQQRMPQPPAGKGRGMGGIGGGGFGRGGGMMSGQRRFSADPYRGNNPFDIYNSLFQQRGMEKELGLDPMAAWRMPQGVPGYEKSHFWQGLYPPAGGEGT